MGEFSKPIYAINVTGLRDLPTEHGGNSPLLNTPIQIQVKQTISLPHQCLSLT